MRCEIARDMRNVGLTFRRAVDGLAHNRTTHNLPPRRVPHRLFLRPIDPTTLAIAVVLGVVVIIQRDAKHVPPSPHGLDKAHLEPDILAPQLRAPGVEPEPAQQQSARGAHPAVRELVRRREHVQPRRARVELHGSRGNASRERACACALRHAQVLLPERDVRLELLECALKDLELSARQRIVRYRRGCLW